MRFFINATTGVFKEHPLPQTLFLHPLELYSFFSKSDLGEDMESISKTIIGWKETFEFLDWGISGVVAATNTQTKRSVIYGRNLQMLDEQTATFDFAPNPTEEQSVSPVSAKISKMITDEPGQEVPLFETSIKIGKKTLLLKFLFVEIADESMVCVLGRKTLAGSFIVDADKKFLASKKPKKKKAIEASNPDTEPIEAT